jgi:PIN domain nuclease of toxin-antitoxin system
MNYLLDTHLVLWAATNSHKLPRAAAKIIANRKNVLWVSVASFWEVAIKRSKLRSDFPFEVGPLRAGLISNGYEELAIEAKHVLMLQDLPLFHADPFDRLFVAQAKAEGMLLLTADIVLSDYGEHVRLV